MTAWQLTEEQLVQAVEYNFGAHKSSKVAEMFRDPGILDPEVWARFPGLRVDVPGPEVYKIEHYLEESRDFCYAVAEIQALAPRGGLRPDGKLGPMTWKYIQQVYGVREYKGLAIIGSGGTPIGMQDEGTSIWQTVPPDSPKGINLHGKTSKDHTRATHVCLHWGGWDPRQLGRYFRDTDRFVSSHGGVGYVPEDGGKISFWQYVEMDAPVRTWHGGWANDLGPGLDLCWQVRKQSESTLLRRYPFLKDKYEVRTNPSGRGDDAYLHPPGELIKALAEVAVVTAHALGVPPRMAFPDRPYDLLSMDEVKESSGIIMHSQWQGNKWDLAPLGYDIQEAVNNAARELLGVG